MRTRRRDESMLLALALAAACVLEACAPTPSSRIDRIYAWKARPTPENLERIRAYLSDPDRDVRVIALEALVSERTEDAAPRSVQALDDPDPYVRSAAARSIGELRATAAITQLVAHLAADPDPQVRRRAAESAARIGGAEAEEGLLRALEDPVREVRLAAVLGSGELDPEASYDSLARIVLEDPDWRTRVASARALGRVSRPEAAATLEAALKDPNEFVRAAAAAALHAPRAHPVATPLPEAEASVPRQAPRRP